VPFLEQEENEDLNPPPPTEQQKEQINRLLEWLRVCPTEPTIPVCLLKFPTLNRFYVDAAIRQVREEQAIPNPMAKFSGAALKASLRILRSAPDGDIEAQIKKLPKALAAEVRELQRVSMQMCAERGNGA
jgi:hypothetical protein